MRQEWSPQPPECENCNKTGPPVFRNFHANPGCAKTATTSVAALENCNKTAKWSREKCNNNGSICAKTVSTPVPHARKVQQHWGQNVRKVCQGLNTIGIYGLGFRVTFREPSGPWNMGARIWEAAGVSKSLELSARSASRGW